MTQSPKTSYNPKFNCSRKFRAIRAITLLGIIFLSMMLGTNSYSENINWDKLVIAIIQVESGGNSNAISRKGCIGLMQINPIVLKEFQETEFPCGNLENLFNPEKNIFLGTWYLHRLHDHYNCQTVEQICAAYNGGPTRLRKCNYDVTKMSMETRNYIKKVIKLYRKELQP